MTSEQKYAMDLAKEITIAKLSNSAPGSSNEESGKQIGNMYEAIYNKIYSISLKESLD